ncbi:NAD(P)H-binding protein [Ralstonia pickettii]|jgi:NAD(P)H dehydrogenase (quinone)|uniref:NmrA family NAD(P)-binding protein n=1 Tax=Ralstonia pickettii TaxID=329 RepID=UPI0015F8C651|nr:NmrA family NAD(P)-binding protein [Ralstonia pickettii]MBB0023806.1 NmrA family transcriptional regulator [Ralstonia pickettii]MBB0033761.1 NmrA family transcriptional regulator [Ralstonia pickettii]MBB0096433.1 NmrA family transcriptional regulator [Ralstonia pickettii]MBB0106229.1 NmrA family transcriptional regulator [Ralstonia pickettii]MBB0126677.1 NmrA family transcriptional regulator [Ralstonia pickettii]
MFVIFGASGKVGRATAVALRNAGRPVRAVVRSARQGEALARIGCEIAIADLTDPASVASAIKGATAVQMLCPVPVGDIDPALTMERMIDVAANALRADPPPAVLALSDYGAELDQGTGLTRLFHLLEERLKPLATQLTLLRSAEHAQNWAAMLPVMLATGRLPSLHYPLDRAFATVATQDVGALAAQLLLDGPSANTPRIVSVEGPRRVSLIDVARAFSAVVGREIVADAVPRTAWSPMLQRAGLSANHVQLLTELYDAVNAGQIDVEKGVSEQRFGKTELHDVFASLLATHMSSS